MKKDAYYFAHFSNSRHDDKLIKLRRIMGIEGYGMFWLLLEVLRDQPNFKMKVESLEDLAYEWHTSREKLEAVIGNFNLFEIQDNYFYSIKFIEYLQPYLIGKEAKRIAGIKGNLVRYKHITKEQGSQFTDIEILQIDENRKNKVSNILPMREVCEGIPIPNGSQSKVKESKVKEKKVNKIKVIKETAYPSFSDFQTYALEKSEKVNIEIDLKQLELKYIGWSENNWINGYGKKIKNWKTTLLNTLKHLEVDLKKATSSEISNTPVNQTPNSILSFEDFFSMYGVDANKKVSQEQFELTTEEERKTIKEQLPIFVLANNEKPDQFKKQPHVYLRDKLFNDKMSNDHVQSTTSKTGKTKVKFSGVSIEVCSQHDFLKEISKIDNPKQLFDIVDYGAVEGREYDYHVKKLLQDNDVTDFLIDNMTSIEATAKKQLNDYAEFKAKGNEEIRISIEKCSKKLMKFENFLSVRFYANGKKLIS